MRWGADAAGALAPRRGGAAGVGVLRERGRAVRVGHVAECPCPARGPAYDVNVGRTTPGRTARRTFSVEERVERLDVESFEDRVPRADDDRELVAAGLLCTPCTAVRGRDLVLDH